VAVVIIILACISLLTGKAIFGFSHAVNYFQAANSFLLLAIALFIVTKHCNCETEKEAK
jgi:large-conductance mechanosensitive channel